MGHVITQRETLSTLTMAKCGLIFLAVLCISYIILVETQIISTSSNEKVSCGYPACSTIQAGKLNVHLVPHTHDDVGWLKTVDQYYYGSRSNIQKAGVQYIIDTAIEALKRDPARRFIYVETAFLWKWWQRQDENMRNDVRKLINEGRLEIIGGSWSMNDEATTHYQSIIDQFTWGFRRLNDTFGECARPKIGWQIDPFGHSREQASLFAQFGFDGMFIGRLDYEDKRKRLQDKSAEFLWHGSSSLGEKSDLFSVVLFNNYSPPGGFCFDVLCSDDPLIDDPNSPDYNIKAKIETFYKYLENQAQHYQTNNIILTMGGDFTYQQSEMYFMNLDKLIRYTNELHGSKVNVFYSTPSCYIKSLNDAQLSWSTKSDDFFPYSSDPHAFWTGYFTSRPTIKYFERMGNNLLQIVKQLTVTSKTSDSEDLENFREVMGVMQHHDAVTGTEKQHVADDYARLLHESAVRGTKLIATAMSKLNAAKEDTRLEYQSCLLLNISACAWSEDSAALVMTIYNPTSQPLSTYVRLPVQGTQYVVKDGSNDLELTSQLVPIAETVKKMPGRQSNATRELVFQAVEVPALGYKSYYVRDVSPVNTEATVDEPAPVQSIDNDLYNISMDDNHGVMIKWKKQALQVVQRFQYYEGMKGNNSGWTNRASGAYIFRPNESVIHNFAYNGKYKFFTGPLVKELHVEINNFISQVIRIYNNDDKIEFDWLVGPIPVDDSIGREVVTRYSSNIESAGTFYTDSNGREMLKRVKNFRPTWEVNLKEPIAGNYYPVTTKISLQDEKKRLRLSVLTDRAQGGTSLNDGQLELMLHRRLLNDDAFGVGEALNEKAFGTGLVVRGTHYLFGGVVDDGSVVSREKHLANLLAHRPWLLFSPVDNASFNQWRKLRSMQVSGLRTKLPDNVQILTLEPWREREILLRLEHMFEVNEAGNYSHPVEVNLMELLPNLKVVAIRETSLGGNQWMEEMSRLKWQTQADNFDNEIYPTRELPKSTRDSGITVTLKPMEIRTFLCAYE